MRTLLVCGLLLGCPVWARAQALPEDLAHVPGDAIGFVHVRTAELWKSPMFKMYRDILPKIDADALSMLEDRITPSLASIDRVTVVFLAPTPQSRGPEFAFLVHTTKPLEKQKLIAGLKEAKEGDVTFYLLPRDGSLRILDPNTLLIGSNEAAVALARKAKPSAAFADGLAAAAAGKKMIVAAVNVSSIPAQAWNGAPPMLQPFAKATSLLATLDLGKEVVLDVDFRFGDAEQARDAERALGEVRQMGKMYLTQGKLEMEKKLTQTPRVVPLHDFEKVAELVGPVFALGMIKRGEELLVGIPVTCTDARVNVKVTMPDELTGYASSGPILIALLLPAVQKVREAASRTQDANNLKQMALAFHGYHDAYRQFPSPAICDKAGKPLLSWRVAILPYIEQDNLYRQFKLDEPWDSEHNKKLLPQMPKLYQMVGDSPSDSQSFYRVFVGQDKNPSALFRSYADKVRMQHITDGTSNTVMIVQSADSVPWTKPEELTYNPNGPLPKLNQTRRGCNVALCDGSVRFLANDIAEQTLRALITRDGGEVIGNLDDPRGASDARPRTAETATPKRPAAPPVPK